METLGVARYLVWKIGAHVGRFGQHEQNIIDVGRLWLSLLDRMTALPANISGAEGQKLLHTYKLPLNSRPLGMSTQKMHMMLHMILRGTRAKAARWSTRASLTRA